MIGSPCRIRRCVCFAVFALCLAAVPIGAAPAAPAPVTPPISFTVGPVQSVGVSTNLVTRYGKPGHLGEPLDRVQTMGAGTILEQLRWDKVEHPCGQWDWVFYDELAREAQKRNLQIIAQLGFNNEQCVPEQFAHTPPDPAAWARFLTTTVTRYKGSIHTWEIWNEPDDTDFWTGTPQQFVDLMALSYQTIKGIDPSARVINGACSKLDLVWCNQYLALGGAAYSDVFGFHPYVGRANFDNGLFEKIDLPHLRDIQGKVNKPIWFTEFGWSSADSGGDSNGIGSEQLQARYMVRQFVTMLGFPGLDLGPMLWYDFRDDGADPASKDAHFGLVGTDWQTPKAGYFAFQQISAHLTGATFVEKRDSGAGTAYRFNRNGTVVDVVWGGGRTSLPTEAREAQAYNIGGQPLPTTVANGTIQVDIADDPIYVEHSRAPVVVGNGAGGTPPGTSGGAPPPAGSGALPPASTLPAASGAAPLPTQNAVAVPAGSSGGLSAWSDPQQLVRLQYPATWRATRLADFANNALELDGPDNLLLFVDIYDRQGTPAQVVLVFRDQHAQSTLFTYSDGAISSTQVGGESGGFMPFTYVPKDGAATTPRDGAIWVVTHGGKEFDFQVRNVGGHATEVAALVNSVVFAR